MSDTSYSAGLAVVANNSFTFPRPAKALYVGTTGNVVVHFAGVSSTSTFPSNTYSNGVNIFVAVPAGTTLKVRVDQLLANTTAGNVVALFEV